MTLEQLAQDVVTATRAVAKLIDEAADLRSKIADARKVLQDARDRLNDEIQKEAE